jgi:hypothetical protein
VREGGSGGGGVGVEEWNKYESKDYETWGRRRRRQK